MRGLHWLLVLGELVCVTAFVTGVAMVFMPAAFMVAGVLGVLVLERTDAQLRASRTSERDR